MNNVKETIAEGVDNAMTYRVYAGVEGHLHLALFEESTPSFSHLLNVCVNVTPEDLRDKLENLSEYWSWNDLENSQLSQFFYIGLHKVCKIVEETSIEDKKLTRSTLYENMTENIVRDFSDIIRPEHTGIKYVTLETDVRDAITYSVYEDEPGRFHLLFYRERVISEIEKECTNVGMVLGLNLKGLEIRRGADWTEVRNWSGTMTDPEMITDISTIIITKCKLVEETFLQGYDLVRKVTYSAMSEQVRDSYEKI